jgi:hypothetical protein
MTPIPPTATATPVGYPFPPTSTLSPYPIITNTLIPSTPYP